MPLRTHLRAYSWSTNASFLIGHGDPTSDIFLSRRIEVNPAKWSIGCEGATETGRECLGRCIENTLDLRELK